MEYMLCDILYTKLIYLKDEMSPFHAPWKQSFALHRNDGKGWP